jgi:2-phospho-L-lactate/phosphoenolpyruvate guanylyltransferase
MERQQYVVIVPVKAPAVGKSRLRLPDPARIGLATAFALDVLHAARETPSVAGVVVVTADPDFARTSTELGLRTVPDGNGLNQSLAAAASAARSWFPDAMPVALCADLPCLTPEDLAAALAGLSRDRAWFVTDADGTGTTMYAAPYDAFEPRFGPGSRAAHRAGGAAEVEGRLATLRRDVDDEAGLAAAELLGLGPHTRAALVAVLS